MCFVNNERTRKLFFASQVSLVLGSVMQLPARHYPTFHPDLMDGAHGFFIGVAIAGMLATVLFNRRGARP
jgi:hypothetical protein